MTVDQVLALMAEDSFQAIERLAAQPDAAVALSLLAETVNEVYWKRKDLHATVALARAGIQHGLTAALATSDAERQTLLRGKSKALAYNLASFTWPGWNEPGIVCDVGSIAAGYDAARMNVRLARELKKGDLPMSRGLWMLAGHELCRRDYAGARRHYLQGVMHAQACRSAADELLGLAFAVLTDVIECPQDGSRLAALAASVEKLAAVENGPAFVQQVENAKVVFVPPADSQTPER